jgi:murein DD-endopeptidase MepM/ murein hydrolase activator NlpD
VQTLTNGPSPARNHGKSLPEGAHDPPMRHIATFRGISRFGWATRDGKVIGVKVRHLLPGLVCAMLAAGCAGESARPEGRDVLLPLDVDVIKSTVPRNATLQGLLKGHKATGDLADSIVSAVRSQFDPRHLKANQNYQLTTSLDGLFREFRYTMDADRFLRVALKAGTSSAAPQFDVEVVAYPKEVVTAAVTVEITKERPSLWAALEDEGENIQLALLLADAFSGDVDFNSDLQPGDRFEVLFARVLRDGQFSGYENVKYALLTNDGRTLTAVRHQGPDGRDAWYDAQGRSLKRQFLKSPLGFEPRVTSSFSYRRRHPVLNTYRAHRGVDYAAAYGTPVVAVSPGVVIAAGWAGGAGRRVSVRHASGYVSNYFHLSAIAAGISPGAKVDQGRTLGRVGNSGTVTGTHLHYELIKNGTHVNPVTAHRQMPPGIPIPASAMPAFLSERDALFGNLRELQAAAAAAASPAAVFPTATPAQAPAPRGQ